MRCSHCGAELEINATFCSSCGQRVSAAAPPPSADSWQNPYQQPAAPIDPVYSQPQIYGTYEDAAQPAKNKAPVGLFIGIGIALVAVIVAVVLLASNVFGGPIAKIYKAAQKTVKKESFTLELSMSGNGGTQSVTVQVMIDFKERDLIMLAEQDNYVSGIYDGYLFSYYPDEEWGHTTDYSDQLDEIFDAYEKGLDIDWDDLLEDLGLDDYLDEEQTEKCVKEYISKLNSSSWLEENAGYTKSSSGGVTTYTFEPDLKEFLLTSLEFFEPAVEDEDDYEEAVDTLEEYDILDDCDVRIDIGVKSGYLHKIVVEVGYDEYSIEVEAEITNVGKTEIDLDDMEDWLEKAQSAEDLYGY